MRHFYVRVRSDYDHTEFPNNSSNHFFNRLPFPLRFDDQGWKVALHSITLPNNTLKLTLSDVFICRITWYVNYDTSGDDLREQHIAIRTSDIKSHVTTGKHLMKAIVDTYMHKLQNQTQDDATLKSNEGKKYYPVFKLDKDTLIIDNTNIYLGDSTKYPKIEFGIEFARKMGWVKVNTKLENSYLLSDNLRKDFPNDLIPTANDIIQQDDPGEESFYEGDADGLRLSVFCNWHFINLDESFRQAYGQYKRVLYVNSNVGEPSIIGGKLTTLLREIPYSEDESHYEVDQLAYVPVRNGILDIIHVQVTELDDQLVNFDQGFTHAVLDFKHDY